jgi:uncharacterized protein YsxB (DUF464 family)
MITISAVTDKTGLLRRCEVRGHAQAGPAGSDIVCAAVSVLCRTALAVLSREGEGPSGTGPKGLKVQGDAPERGVFLLEVEEPGGAEEYLRAAGEFLLEGLASVARDYPQNCRMAVTTE